MKKFIYAAALALMPWLGFAQLSGTISDAKTGEKISGAAVRIEGSYLNAISDADGKFSFPKIGGASAKITVSHIGYETITLEKSVSGADISITLTRKSYQTDEVTVTATRAADNSPTAFSNIDKKTIEEKNLGQDLPFLLATTPSVVVTSDAGNAVGYTGIRIRGSDATRVNVTINGIPVNDAESHQVYWVDLPDFASSVESIQIQRGIGTSANGAGAFGGSVNIQSHSLSQKPFAEINSSAGSFNTFKNTVGFGTGLLNNHFAVEGRLSKITSDGYIDRATSDLKSFYLSGGYYGSRSSFRLIAFSGHEKTYQAWYGVPEDSLTTNRTFNPAGLHYDANGNIQYYENQTDNYQQDYYQLHWTYAATQNININAALNYTKGKGYYEEYHTNVSPLENGINQNVTFDSTTLANGIDEIRQLWLDNDFYGLTASANYDKDKLQLTFGGAAYTYEGRHYNQITWAQVFSAPSYPFIYDDNHATKNDANAFLKALWSVKGGMHLYADVQYRAVSYSFEGFKDDLSVGQNQVDLSFFNPKAGWTYDINAKSKVYVSVAQASKEPMRDDYVDSPPYTYPKPERMFDGEAGYKFSGNKLRFGVNFYNMVYKDQLILTGKLNDVGAYTRINVPDSYRRGVEVEAAWNPLKDITLSGNVTVSDNKIKTFDEYIDNWDDGTQQLVVHKNADISFSPPLTSSIMLSYTLFRHTTVENVMRYVGEQFLDNTSDKNRMLDAYLTDDVFLSYHISAKDFKDIALKLAIYNVSNTLYESNGWTYPYIYGGEKINENGFYPQAGTNWMAGVSLKF